MRRLLSTRRTVPLVRFEEYADAWDALRNAAEARGVRAWMFRGAEHEDRFIEFLEWSTDASPVDALAGELNALDECAPAQHREEWEEAGIP